MSTPDVGSHQRHKSASHYTSTHAGRSTPSVRMHPSSLPPTPLFGFARCRGGGSKEIAQHRGDWICVSPVAQRQRSGAHSRGAPASTNAPRAAARTLWRAPAASVFPKARVPSHPCDRIPVRRRFEFVSSADDPVEGTPLAPASDAASICYSHCVESAYSNEMS